jgi:ubiquinone/menaquinone biosynthesis C-methylase UbiE
MRYRNAYVNDQHPMKARESGMPHKATWEAFFVAREILVKLGLSPETRDVVDFGCGYGTFTLAAARMIRGQVHALDIEPDMIDATNQAVKQEGLTNVRACQRDFLTDGTGLPDASVDYVMLFNILHCEQPQTLLHEAQRLLASGGGVGIVHWNYDPSTPRGPSMAIRPRPMQCQQWAADAGLKVEQTKAMALGPYHYGFTARKGQIA